MEWSHGARPRTIWPSTVQFRVKIGRLWCLTKTTVYVVSFEGTAVCWSLRLVPITIISSTLIHTKLLGQGRLIMTGLERRRWTWLWIANGLSKNRHRRKLSTRRILAEVSPWFRQTILLSRCGGGGLSIAHCIRIPENGILALWESDEGDEQSSFCPSQHSSQIHVDIYGVRYLFCLSTWWRGETVTNRDDNLKLFECEIRDQVKESNLFPNCDVQRTKKSKIYRKREFMHHCVPNLYICR